MQTRAMKWNQSSISKLTDDCLITLFNYLPVFDRIRVERVCKRWRHLSKVSWYQFKCLDFEIDIWGSKEKFEEMSRNELIIIIENLLKRCGGFLTSIHCKKSLNYDLLTFWDDQVIKIILDSCPNLETFEAYMNITKNSISLLKPIMSKVKIFFCVIDDVSDVSDEDLEKFFCESKALLSLRVVTKKGLDGSFVRALPSNCITCFCYNKQCSDIMLRKLDEARAHVCYSKYLSKSIVMALVGDYELCNHVPKC